MKGIAVIALLAVVLAVVAAKPAEDKYTTKYDNVDLEEILKNKRLLKNYVNCLLEKGNCSPDGAELKKVLPDAIKSECSKCSEKQKNGSRTVLRHLIDKEPEMWKELEAKYDPTGDYAKKYRAEAEKEGIKLP
ncbi:PREDICTED: ejaculatory bulb-specific protein 3-like [Nicrophorus vespilloides]|uniref:Ejaculatory bulb-specific protein 3-like n=1 Tax=Nicrophorus vespilloides TaxID=110193 RepID=A0ABM1MYL0_NICVS|nr:PREDICTED: ejaculatory bulb-specific protein 3-like [Nicrophorus vespilloides]